MTDPILATVATTLADKAAAALVSGGASAVRALFDLVRSKFTGRKDAEQALQDAQDQPERPEHIERLTEALARAIEEDPRFGSELQRLWKQARTELKTDRGGVINQVSGTVGGHVVMARDVTGGINLGSSGRPEN
jgi:hypothetical protein